MVSIKALTFTYIIPDIVEVLPFVPNKYKTETQLINKVLHKLSVPLTLSAFIFFAAAPLLSGGLFAGSMLLHLIGHILEGILNS